MYSRLFICTVAEVTIIPTKANKHMLLTAGFASFLNGGCWDCPVVSIDLTDKVIIGRRNEGTYLPSKHLPMFIKLIKDNDLNQLEAFLDEVFA